MKKAKAMQIEGASVMPEMKMERDGFRYPEINPSYRLMINANGFPFVTNDGKNFVLAISVIVNGEERNPMDLLQMLEEVKA